MVVQHASTLDDLDRIIHILYEAAVIPELWPAALEAIGERLGGCALGMSLQPYKAPPRAFAHVGFDMKMMARNYPDRHTNPMVAAMSRLPPSVATVRQAITPNSDYFGSGLYNEVFRPQRLVHAAAGCAFKSADLFVPLGIFRHTDQGELGEHELELLRLVLPHLRRGIQIYLRISSLSSQQEATDIAINQLPFGLVFFNATGVIWKLNSVAEEIIAEDNGLVIRNGELHAAEMTENYELGALIRSAAGSGTGGWNSMGGAMAISRPASSLPLSLRIVPLPVSNTDLGLDRPGAAAFIADATRNTNPSEDAVMRMLNLTAAEAKVACLLVTGLSVEEVAQRLGNKSSTIRAHLKSIFGKTDTGRQSELVGIILRGVAASNDL